MDETIQKLIESYSKFVFKEAQTAERFSDPDEAFEKFLPLTLGEKHYFDLTEGELTKVRDFSRLLAGGDEVVITILDLYKSHIVGDGIMPVITPKNLEGDPEAIADRITNDPKAKELLANFEAFSAANNLHAHCENWVVRRHRDGEKFTRIFDSKLDYAGLKVPTIRFIEPGYITGDNKEDKRLGIIVDPNDVQTVKGYNYRDDNGKDTPIPAEEVIHDKANVDVNFFRGMTTFYPIFTNLRRISKNLVNVSVLTGIQSAIALIRKHSQNANSPKLQQFIARNSDGKFRKNDISGNSFYAKQLLPGTVIDGGMGVDYEFPAHTVSSKNYIDVIDKELAHVGIRTHLPVKWLIGMELDKPLAEGSPTIKFFRSEQRNLSNHLVDLFWRVQERMGIDPKMKLEYSVSFFGPELAVGDAESEARVSEIEIRNGALSPQTWAARRRRNYAIERAQMIQHRKTKQPGEVMPGDAGNTNVTGTQPSAGQGGDGKTKANPQTSGKTEEIEIDDSDYECILEDNQIVLRPKHHG